MNYIRNIKNILKIDKNIEFYFKALFALFIIAGVLGFITAQIIPVEAKAVVDKAIQDISFVNELSAIEIFAMIFLNNSIKAFFMMFLGILFGVIPVVFILLNGYAVGIVMSVVIVHASVISVLLGILPHGIFEIFAILLAAGYGVWLGEVFSKKIKGKGVFIPHLKIALKKFINIILPIIALAALIEAFITNKLLTLFLM